MRTSMGEVKLNVVHDTTSDVQQFVIMCDQSELPQLLPVTLHPH